MNRYISLIALMALFVVSAQAAEISAPPTAIPSAPGASPGGASITPPAAPTGTGAPAGSAAPASGVMSLSDMQAAAEKGDVTAEFALAEHYGQRNSLDADFGVAAKWYEKAANQGNKDAQFKLGTLYQDSLGVSQNYPLAYFWVSLATKDSTNKVWLAKRDDIEKLLKPEQAAAVKAKVDAWKPNAGDQPAAPQ